MASVGQYKEQAEQEFTLPDEGYYILKLVGEDPPIPSRFDKPKGSGIFPLRVNLKFEIVKEAISGDDEFAGEEASIFCGLDLEPWRDDSIYHVLKALDPSEEPEANADTEDYYGKLCIGEIKHVKKPKKDDPGKFSTFPNIVSVKEYKRKSKKAAPPPAEIADDSDALFGDDVPY